MTLEPVPELDSRPQGRREWSGWLTSLVLPLGFVVALVGGLLFLQSDPGGSHKDSPYGTVALADDHNPTGEAPRAEAGRAAPDFLLEPLTGPLVHLSDLQGRPVVISFFTTWCTGCRAQMPVLVAGSKDNGDKVVFLAVNLQEAADRVNAFLRDLGVDFPILLDRTGEVASTWRVGGPGQPLPATFFIDATGVVRKVVNEPVTAADISAGLSLIEGGKN